MSAFPGSIGGQAGDGAATDWLEDLTRQMDRFVGASTDEARTLAGGLRRAFKGERLEQAFSALRAKLRRVGAFSDGTVVSAEERSEIEHEFRTLVREFGLEGTIEQWTRHAVAPPSIRL